MALTELGALPATYRHITTTVVTGASAAPVFVRLRATIRFLVVVLDGICGNAAGAALPGTGCRRTRRVRAAHSAQLVLPFARGRMTRLSVTGVKRQLSPLPVEIDLQGRYPGMNIGFGELQLTAFVTEFRVPLQLSGALLGLLFPAQRAHQHVAARGVHVRQRRRRCTQHELAHLVRVLRTARLDDSERSIAFAAADQIRQMDPGIRNRRDLQVGRFSLWIVALDERGDDCGDLVVPHLVDEAVADGTGRAERAALADGRQRIDHNTTRLMLAKQRCDSDQVVFRVGYVRPAGIHAHQTGLHVGIQVNSDRSEIASDSLAAFVKTHEQRALAAPTGAFRELPRQSRLRGARRTRDQGAAAAEQAPAQDRGRAARSRWTLVRSKPRAARPS